jgi:hypothetical protein
MQERQTLPNIANACRSNVIIIVARKIKFRLNIQGTLLTSVF